MRIPILILASVLVWTKPVKAQILSTASNKPSQVYPGGRIASGAKVYGVFVGRIACQEIMTELNEGVRMECAKRKVSLILYQDSVTHAPTTYTLRGMGKWTGTGKWQIVRGTATDPEAIVFKLELAPTTSLFLFNGDDNVLLILDRNKNFLVGNEKYSYALNRARN